MRECVCVGVCERVCLYLHDTSMLPHQQDGDSKQQRNDQLFLAPTVFDFGNDESSFVNSSLMAQEIFGPLLPVFR
jgi:acyl-CoA reductase-like NAD-dependent aldehyde dehydrogenase